MCDSGSFVETPTPFPQYTRGLVATNMVWLSIYYYFLFFRCLAAADPVAAVAHASVARAAAAAELPSTYKKTYIYIYSFRQLEKNSFITATF